MSEQWRVLVVDDHAPWWAAVTRALAADSRFAAVAHASDLASARRALQGGGWDVAVVDPGLADEDGLELLGQAGARSYVVMSAEDERESRAVRLGAVFATKSVTAAELVDLLAHACDRSDGGTA